MAEIYPTKGNLGTNARTDGLSSYDEFSRNYIKDYRRLEVFNSSTGIVAGDSGGTAQSNIENSSLSTCIEFDNAETHGFHFTVPDDMDVTKDAYMRVIWGATEATAPAETANHVLLYKHIILGTTAVAVPATAFSTNAGTQTSHGAHILGATGMNKILASAMTTFVPGESRLFISNTVALVTIAKSFVHAYEFFYFRRFIG